MSTNIGIFLSTALTLVPLSPLVAQPVENSYQVIVNSNYDGSIQPDDRLTLREAIALVNGSLPLTSLSNTEKNQVQLIDQAQSSIQFDLPPGAARISLRSKLAPLTSAGLIVDGTTNPGYIDIPVVELTPAPNTEIQHGLTVVADNIVIRGLSLYGFSTKASATITPADILIAPSQFLSGQSASMSALPPAGVVIEDNWLGTSVNDPMPPVTSAFGISIFNSLDTTIRRNRIANHNGSAIITLAGAQNLRVTENTIVDNGRIGMPDGIRLGGNIEGSQIDRNLISGNGGSAVYLFKPDGAVTIRANQIESNGKRYESAAIYLIGNDHQVIDNEIGNQPGAGVAVAAYPPSRRNIITNNRFAALDGLSIDLITRDRVDAPFFHIGDGSNPRRDSSNRRKDTGNAAINAPRFKSEEFFVINNRVGIDGVADKGSSVTVYRVEANKNGYEALGEPLATVDVDSQGHFSLTLESLQPGDSISAIATDPRYGTSEPAETAVVRSLFTGQK